MASASPPSANATRRARRSMRRWRPIPTMPEALDGAHGPADSMSCLRRAPSAWPRCAGASPRRRAPRAAIPAAVTLVAVSKTHGAEPRPRAARRRPARVRREPRAGGGGEVSGAEGAPSRPRAAPDRAVADQQGARGGGAVRRHPVARPRAAGRHPRQGDGARRPPAALLRPGQHRRGAAEGGRAAGATSMPSLRPAARRTSCPSSA